MSLLEEITSEVGVDDVDLRLEQRRMALIQQIKELLEQKGWSRRRLAEEMGKEDSQITRLLSPSSNPTLKTLVEIESALDRELFTVNRNIERKHSFEDVPVEVRIVKSNISKSQNLVGEHGWKRALRGAQSKNDFMVTEGVL
jgi:transcriptional regulator with XRE-family HTH domain